MQQGIIEIDIATPVVQQQYQEYENVETAATAASLQVGILVGFGLLIQHVFFLHARASVIQMGSTAPKAPNP